MSDIYTLDATGKELAESASDSRIATPPREIASATPRGTPEVAAFKKATVVERLPKTRSGKVLRGTMKRIADRQEWRMPATIDDPVIFEEITDSLAEVGYGPEAVE